MRAIHVLPLLLASSAAADVWPDRVSLLVGSHHVDSEYDFNETNPGVFLTWDRWSLGTYLNSYDRQSVAVTYTLPVFTGDDWSVDLFAGIAHYPENGRNYVVHVGDVIPVGGLQARYENVFVQVIPSDGIATDAIISFGLTTELDIR